MAKVHPERSTPADSTQWMPLREAFKHIKQVVGGWQLAAEDLRLRLVSGDVEAQDRVVTRGEGIEIKPLTREDWKGREAHPNADDLWFSGFFPLHGHNIFLRRAHVYRWWPIAAEKPTLPIKRPKGIGRRVWLCAQEVYALTREGGEDSNWIDLDALLDTIRNRIGSNQLSPRTLDSALAFLRKHRLIDR